MDVTNWQPRDIYIIFDLSLQDAAGERQPIDSDKDWGRLPGQEAQSAIARVARSILDLKMECHFMLDNRLEWQPEIVPVRQENPGLPLIRETVV